MSSPTPSRHAGEPTAGLGITALIPTFNEEENIEECLASVEWCDEVLVVDSFSTDRTSELAARRGATLLSHEYVNSATQKNWAIPRCSNPWVLLVDADERVTPELAGEVRRLLADGPSADAYTIRRVNYFLGRRIRHGGWEADRVIRLFRRDGVRYQDREVHAEVDVKGEAPELASPLIHYTFRSFRQYWPKVARYSDWGASQAFKDGRRVGALSVLLRPVGRFVKMYLLRRGFLDGGHGLVLALFSAMSVYLKYAKLWEMTLRERETGRQ